MIPAPAASRKGLFEDEHETFRESFRSYLEKEVAPGYDVWRRDGIPREVFKSMAEYGFVGMSVPEEHGGAGIDDFRFNVVVVEEAMRAGLGALALMLSAHNDVAVPLLARLTTDEQQAEWMEGLAAGELIAAIGPALDGPTAGVVNGGLADLVVVIGEDGSLGVVEGSGLERHVSEEMVGMHGVDMADLNLGDVSSEPLGSDEESAAAFGEIRLWGLTALAAAAVAGSRAAIDMTLEYVQDRRAFGQPIAAFENTRFVLAQVAAETDSAQAFLDACIRELTSGELTDEHAAAAKLTACELFGRATDTGLQLHGGYGYMLEYPISHAYADARFLRLYGGASEEMKEVVAASLGI